MGEEYRSYGAAKRYGGDREVRITVRNKLFDTEETITIARG